MLNETFSVIFQTLCCDIVSRAPFLDPPENQLSVSHVHLQLYTSLQHVPIYEVHVPEVIYQDLISHFCVLMYCT